MTPFVESGQEDSYADGKNLILDSHRQEQFGILRKLEMHASSVLQSYLGKCILRISGCMSEVR